MSIERCSPLKHQLDRLLPEFGPLPPTSLLSIPKSSSHLNSVTGKSGEAQAVEQRLPESSASSSAGVGAGDDGGHEQARVSARRAVLVNRALLRLMHLASFLAGRTVFDSAYYRESELTRLMNLFAHVDLDRWRGMQVLEVGAGPGRLGDAFVRLGFSVTSSDGRPEHVDALRARGRNAFVIDLDRTPVDASGEFDLILAFGVLYHLAQPAFFLRGCRKAKVLLLETAVHDNFAPVLQTVRESGGWRSQDQSVSRVGTRPSPRWVEEQCRDAGFDSVRDISSSLGDWSIGSFDWEARGLGEWRREGTNLRKMWVCERQSRDE